MVTATDLWILFGILVITLICIVIYLCTENRDVEVSCIVIIIITTLIASLIALASAIIIPKEPKAIDVYQDKTTLKYTIVDSTIVDSTVIFKEDW